MKNTLHVYEQDEAKRKQLAEEYTFLGYFVSLEKDRLVVSSKPPAKRSVKKDKPRFSRERDNR